MLRSARGWLWQTLSVFVLPRRRTIRALADRAPGKAGGSLLTAMITTLVSLSLASLPALSPTVFLSLLVTAIWMPMIAFLIAALAEFLAIRLFKARNTRNEGSLVVTLCLYQACVIASLGLSVAGVPPQLSQAVFPPYLLVLMGLTLATLAGIRFWQAATCVFLALPVALAGGCFMASINMWVPRLAVP